MSRLSFIRVSPKTLRRVVIAFNGLLILLTFVVIFSCGRLGIHSRKDVMDYHAIIQGHYHPVWKDLAWQRIHKGDPIEKVLKRHPPLRRDDFPPYTVLRYDEIGSSDRLVIEAKDGRLISTGAGDDTWTRFFFDSPEEEQALDKAYSAYVQQRMLDSQAFQIHQVIKGGQDAFLAQVTNSRPEEYSPEMLEELEAIYGREYLVASGMMTEFELTVEVTAVLYGDLEVGTVLTFPADNCRRAKAGEPEPVFLHVDDMRLLNPRNKAGEGYLTVGRKALDWYESLTPDQVKDLEARGLARQSERWQPEEPLTRHPRKPRTKPPRQWFHRDTIF